MEDTRTVAEIKHNISLIDTHNERLRVLELQAAQLGIRVDPHVVTEIKQIKQRIEALEQKIEIMYAVEKLYIETAHIMVHPKALLVDIMQMLTADEYSTDLMDEVIKACTKSMEYTTEIQVILDKITELMKKYRAM